MLWDRGTYGPPSESATTAHADGRHSDESILRQAYDKGDFKFELYGERLRGSWVLVRTRYGSSSKEQWLLIKHRDEYAVRGSDIVAEEVTSVATGRTMDEIEAGATARHAHHE
jgi:bifunctional non-homologous end joining protein LigD